MSTITTRAGKGSQLTWTEVDTNFTNLNTDKIQAESAGTTGQVLTKTATGADWATASSGNNIVVLSSGNNISGVTFPATANTAMTNSWTLSSTGGISGVSVSTNTFTLPAGTYTILFPQSNSANASKSDWQFYNTTDSSIVASFSYDNFTLGGVACALYGAPSKAFTIAGSKTFTLRTTSAVSGGWTLQSGHWSAGYVVQVIKTA